MLIDTDIVIWYMRDNPNAVEILDSNKGFLISVVSYMELVQGMRNRREFKALKTALTIWKAKLLQIDEAISMKAMFYVEQYFLSHSIRLADALIASTAIVNKIPLITGDLKHFRVFKELKLHSFKP
jgi:predicted nucleic acid-binding protein